ncbi:MAG: pantoate--beta-alanine ligase [Rhodospirillaceae bacterium]
MSFEPALSEVRSVDDLRATVAAARATGQKVALVPTMGALHVGHQALIRQAAEQADLVVVSVFVNPTQFGPNEDLASYPRDETGDLEKIAEAGGHVVYLPPAEVMYPPGFCTTITVAGPSQGLCGAARPIHFQGVATVVAKLLIQCGPDMAFFGQKDYQQLQVIRRLVTDLNLSIEIVGVETVREPDGLALSSRNAYLSSEQRKLAPELVRTLRRVAADILGGADVEDCAVWGREELLALGFDAVDYLEVRDADSLEPIAELEAPARILVAAHLGRARLIDNISLEP